MDKRRGLTLFLALVTVVIAVLVVQQQIRPSADTLSGMEGESCEADSNQVEVVVVAVGQSYADNQLTAYNQYGQAIIDGGANLASDTYEQIGEESVEAIAEDPGPDSTPLGVYTAGQVWTNKQDATLNGKTGTYVDDIFIQFHESISGEIATRIGDFFIDLSGEPVDGGLPVVGLGHSKDPVTGKKIGRAIGIHSRSGDWSTGATLGCIKTSGDRVIDLIKAGITGKKVIVTDAVLAGTIDIVDPESHDPNFSDPAKIEKGILNADVAVTGERVGNIYNFTTKKLTGHSWWLAETAKPTGAYEINVDAGGYVSDDTQIEYQRATNTDSGHPGQLTKTSGSTYTLLAIPEVDGMYSDYFGAYYPNGYGYPTGDLLISRYDTAFSVNWVSAQLDSESRQLVLPVNHLSPDCTYRQILADQTDNTDEGSFECGGDPIVSTFGVMINGGPWHDLGYGGRNVPAATDVNDDAPETGQASSLLATFDFDYTNPVDTIVVDIGQTLTAEQQKNLRRWGVSISKIGDNGHEYNDYIGLGQVHSNVPTAATDDGNNPEPSTSPETPTVPDGSDQQPLPDLGLDTQPQTPSSPSAEPLPDFGLDRQPQSPYFPLELPVESQPVEDYQWFTPLVEEPLAISAAPFIEDLPIYAPEPEMSGWDSFVTDTFNWEPEPVIYNDPYYEASFIYQPEPEPLFNDWYDYALPADYLDYSYNLFSDTIESLTDWMWDSW